MSAGNPLTILVAGDVCLDVLGVPVPPPAITQASDNWRLTGETRMHYLPGGAMLLAEMLQAAIPDADVRDTRPCRPSALRSDAVHGDDSLSRTAFMEIADRLTRKDIVHSLLSLGEFPTAHGEKDCVLRVREKFGYSGPDNGDPTLKLIPPQSSTVPQFLVLDDTGNRFRRTRELWPKAVLTPDDPSQTVLIHKLHRPLPDQNCAQPDTLWQTTSAFNDRVVILSVDDLRSDDALISSGISWERTALDLVWQLLNRPTFAALRRSPHLVVQLGLDGAVYWQRIEQDGSETHRAWLVYDPNSIEGGFASTVPGQMVGFGTAFTAGFVQHLAQSHRSGTSPLTQSVICKAIQQGLLAGRRLLQLGFGPRTNLLCYPTTELFTQRTKSDADFACQPIPIIPQAAVPDRSYWRLLDTIFRGQKSLLHRAVALIATGAPPATPEDHAAADLLKQVPIAVFAKALRAYDRREIENYRALYALMLDYILQQNPARPLSVAVFGPPGAGKSFGIKMVAKALSGLSGSRLIETLTFNLSQYQSPAQLADAFHLVRDLVLRGRIPLVFFDEFDAALGDQKLGWLRYFLAPMQDAEFLDRGAPHPIGQAIFVFAGGTCSTYAQFAEPFLNEQSPRRDEFKDVKGPDFLSRLRGTLDIPGLDLHVDFDSYGPVDAFPCDAATLLRRAGILAFQLAEKAPWLRDAGRTLRVSPVVLRALIHLPHFEHGNRSLEALLDMSHLANSSKFTPALLPSPTHASGHVDPAQFNQLLGTDYPFPAAERELIAQAIHESYREQALGQANRSSTEPSLQPWDTLPEDMKESSREQADHIAVKLRCVGLWFRKAVPGLSNPTCCEQLLNEKLEALARMEHDRWVAERRRHGWIAGANTARNSRNDALLIHNLLVTWEALSDEQREQDREPVRKIPGFLGAAGYEVISA